MKLLAYSGKKLTNELDAAVRKILHQKFPEPTCFVCGRRIGWFHPKTNPQGIQVGHYISRSVHILRWDFKNIEPQCAPCNRIHQTLTLPFTNRIIAVYGKERIDYLYNTWNKHKLSGGKMSTGQKRAILFNLTQ